MVGLTMLLGLQAVAQQPETASGMPMTFAPVVTKVAPSVVSINTSKTVRIPRGLRDFFGMPGPGAGRERERGLGSGVIVSEDGYILTNRHVIDAADEIVVHLADQKEYKAKKIGADPGTDVAVLKIDAKGLPVLPFADSDKARVGDVVLAVGNPFGLTQTVTMGIVSGLGRGGMGIVDYENFIQTDASINPGNSGGALVDMSGRLLGINTAIFSRTGGNQGIGFAVPSNLAQEVLKSIRETGRVIRGYLGTVIQPVTPELASAFNLKEATGALVSDVSPGSPADKAGIQHGDVITTLDGKKVEGPRTAAHDRGDAARHQGRDETPAQRTGKGGHRNAGRTAAKRCDDLLQRRLDARALDSRRHESGGFGRRSPRGDPRSREP